MYGPLSLQALSVLFCKTSLDGQQYSVIEPTVNCDDTAHKITQWFARGFLVLLMGGVMAMMWRAARKFFDALDADPTDDAEELAKKRCGDAWAEMKQPARAKEIEKCAQELRLQLLGMSTHLNHARGYNHLRCECL